MVREHRGGAERTCFNWVAGWESVVLLNDESLMAHSLPWAYALHQCLTN